MFFIDICKLSPIFFIPFGKGFSRARGKIISIPWIHYFNLGDCSAPAARAVRLPFSRFPVSSSVSRSVCR
jgi:hypothetical protein